MKERSMKDGRKYEGKKEERKERSMKNGRKYEGRKEV